MKVAILAGGRGSRLGALGKERPKGLVEIGGEPILGHLMRYYAGFGFDQFVVALGYLGEMISEYLATSPWNTTAVDTGLDTETGGRIKRLAPYLGSETFMLTWTDGLADIDLAALLRFHRAHGRLATLTAVQPPIAFGSLRLEEGGRVQEFVEKKPLSDQWINGAFFVLEPEVFDYIEGDDTRWEHGPLPRLARDGQLMAYRHPGFWQCMDTPQQHADMERLWQSGEAPWMASEKLVAGSLI